MDRAIQRLRDIQRSIAEIRSLLAGKSFEQVSVETVTLAAFERFLEILSEASRHIPETWKAEHAAVPWREVADLGNLIRHEYFRVQSQALWEIYQSDLAPLDRAVDAMLEAHGSKDNRS